MIKPRMSGVLVVIAAGFAACGSSQPPSTGPSAVEGEAVTAVVFAQTLEDFPPGEQRALAFSLPRRGTLSVAVRWNDQLNSVAAALSGTDCVRLQRQTERCPVRRSIERQGREGREAFIDQANAGGDYELVVENLGPGPDSIQVTAELRSFVTK